MLMWAERQEVTELELSGVKQVTIFIKHKYKIIIMNILNTIVCIYYFKTWHVY